MSGPSTAAFGPGQAISNFNPSLLSASNAWGRLSPNGFNNFSGSYFTPGQGTPGMGATPVSRPTPPRSPNPGVNTSFAPWDTRGTFRNPYSVQDGGANPSVWWGPGPNGLNPLQQLLQFPMQKGPEAFPTRNLPPNISGAGAPPPQNGTPYTGLPALPFPTVGVPGQGAAANPGAPILVNDPTFGDVGIGFNPVASGGRNTLKPL